MSKVWLITGSSRGLGRALAEAVLAAGHSLIATARDTVQLVDFVERYGSQVRTVALDVTDERAAVAAIQTASEAFGQLDVLVNNAGYANIGSIEEMSTADFRAQVETNFFGVVNVTRAAIPILRRQKSGHVIQITTIGARTGSPGLSAYQAAKWGVEGFSEVLAKELGPLGVKVTIVELGGFRTDWAGASMTISDNRPEYDSSVGALAQHVRTHSGLQPGDPSKAALAILKIAAVDDPPLRLLLGGSAVQIAEQVEKARSESDRKWRDLSLSVDFESKKAPFVFPWEP